MVDTKKRNTNTESIKKVAQRVGELPTLPTVVSKMLEMIGSRRSSADTLARLISTDQVLTARVLKLANSAIYGYPREISTVNMAIVVIGFEAVKDVVISCSLGNVFKNAGDATGLDAVKYWEHSAACGVAARMLSRGSNSRYSGEAFVAGLLHDIGKMVLDRYFGAELVEVMKAAQEGGCGLDRAESEILGVTHGRVGAWLAEKWNLPTAICDAIRHHHEPWESEIEPSFVAMVTVADLLCQLTKIGDSGRKALPLYDDRLWQIFQTAGIPIDESDLERLQEDFLAEYSASEAYLSVVQGGEVA